MHLSDGYWTLYIVYTHQLRFMKTLQNGVACCSGFCIYDNLSALDSYVALYIELQNIISVRSEKMLNSRQVDHTATPGIMAVVTLYVALELPRRLGSQKLEMIFDQQFHHLLRQAVEWLQAASKPNKSAA